MYGYMHGADHIYGIYIISSIWNITINEPPWTLRHMIGIVYRLVLRMVQGVISVLADLHAKWGEWVVVEAYGGFCGGLKPLDTPPVDHGWLMCLTCLEGWFIRSCRLVRRIFLRASPKQLKCNINAAGSICNANRYCTRLLVLSHEHFGEARSCTLGSCLRKYLQATMCWIDV